MESLGLQRFCADGRNIRPSEYAPRKKYTKLSRRGDGQVQCCIGKRCFPFSVNVNN